MRQDRQYMVHAVLCFHNLYRGVKCILSRHINDIINTMLGVYSTVNTSYYTWADQITVFLTNLWISISWILLNMMPRYQEISQITFNRKGAFIISKKCGFLLLDFFGELPLFFPSGTFIFHELLFKIYSLWSAVQALVFPFFTNTHSKSHAWAAIAFWTTCEF